MPFKYITEVAPAKPAANGKPAVGPEYRNVIAKEGPTTLDGIGTLYELFQTSVKKYGGNACLGSRKVVDGKAGDFEWITYKEADEIVSAVGSAMVACGVGPKDRCGIYGANSEEWFLAMQACNRHSVWCVPLYDSLGENAIDYIIKHSGAGIVFVSAAKMPTLVGSLPGLKGVVKTVVAWGAVDAGKAKAVADAGFKFHSWDEFIALGKASPAPPSPPKPEDLSTIMYTSGTTGDPKGVMLSHTAVVATIASGIKFINEQMGIHLGEDDVFLSYLPLAHILDRVSEELFIALGARIGYWRGDIKLLVDDIGALRPTYFAGVPRVFERIHAGIKDKVDAGGGLKKFLFYYGYNRKLHALQSGRTHKNASPFFDALVFGKVKERLGGRVKAILSGGAPLSKAVEEFLKVTMCCPVVQGYGLTETCAASFVGVADDYDMTGTVGPVLPVLSFRLEAVPEMNYDPMADPPRGEVCVKGPSVFSGYYKQDDKTAEVLEADGWFHTGDIGTITACGALQIFDRKKNIFKLSQGEYVAVEKVEEVYKGCAAVEQVWVYGNSFESSLVAVVVPKEAALQEWAKAGGKAGGAAELCADPAAAGWLLEAMTKTAREGKLKGFEVVKAVYLEPEPWTPEGEMLTPTFKMKRPQLQKKYQAQIDKMYASMKK